MWVGNFVNEADGGERNGEGNGADTSGFRLAVEGGFGYDIDL